MRAEFIFGIPLDNVDTVMKEKDTGFLGMEPTGIQESRQNIKQLHNKCDISHVYLKTSNRVFLGKVYI